MLGYTGRPARSPSDPHPSTGIPHLNDYARAPNQLRCLKGGRLANAPSSGIQLGVVTLVTAVRNSASTLSRTIDSVRAQSYPLIEYIVVDGGSTDGTVELLRQRDREIDLWLSETDRGISDAFNKGIALASGEFVALVNADDWLEPEHIAQSIDSLTRSGADFSFGNLLLHDETDVPLYRIIGDERYGHRLHHAMPALNHPSMVCRSTQYARYGLYDLSYRIGMDYEWFLRNHKRGAVGTYVPSLTSHMGAAGVSQRDIRTSLLEVRRASVAYGYPTCFAALRYHVRLLRVHTRMLLEQWLPPRLLDPLRTALNPSYRRAPSNPHESQHNFSRPT